MKNLNLLFNKTYYSNLSDIDFNLLIDEYGKINKQKEKQATEVFHKSLVKKNDNIFSVVFKHERDYAGLGVDVAPHQFLMKVRFPGLVLGTGNPHGSHLSKRDYNIGFAFEYVTGQPYIPASSIKGVARNFFKLYPEQAFEVVKDIVGNEIDIDVLEKELFDGNDVFFDAVIYDGDDKGMVVGSDIIAPHNSPIKTPVPIMFLKVLPDVRFMFAFKFKEGKGCLMNAAQKAKLICRAIELLGIGGMTNKGYGSLSRTDDYSITEKFLLKDVIICKTCGKEYILTDFEKKKVAETRLPIKWCKDCRDKHYIEKTSRNDGGQNENI